MTTRAPIPPVSLREVALRRADARLADAKAAMTRAALAAMQGKHDATALTRAALQAVDAAREELARLNDQSIDEAKP